MAEPTPTPATAQWTSPIVILAYLITGGFFGVLVLIMFVSVNTDMKDPLMLMLGAVMSAFTGIVGYYFGSTNAEARKDATIKDLTKTAAVVASTAQATQVASDVAAGQGSSAIKASEVTIDAAGAQIEIANPSKGNP